MADISVQPLPGRSCGSCTLCCGLPDIDELDKPANSVCRHCILDRGCTAYEERPATCRDFLCAWMSDGNLGPEWDPTVCHMMVYSQGPQFTVLVDPRYPDAWRQEPHFGQLTRRAADLEPRGGYVIVYIGDDVVKVEGIAPDLPPIAA
ncbi:MAG: hypothetical protein KUL88_08990 [Rhizobium sp.]|nr:hypothetical protein [Rhizobium sp.]